jgi:hypothetical protein
LKVRRILLLYPSFYSGPIVERLPNGWVLHETGATVQVPSREKPSEARRRPSSRDPAECPVVERIETEAAVDVPRNPPPREAGQIVTW